MYRLKRSRSDRVEKIDDDENITDSNLYSVRIHLKSGKMYSRQLFEPQFEELKDNFKELLV